MRRLLLVVCALACASVAVGAGSITFFLSEQGNAATLPTVGNPALTASQLAADGSKLYLWATKNYAEPHWNGVAICPVLTGDLTSPGITLYNPTDAATGVRRWYFAGDAQPNALGQTLAITVWDPNGIGILPGNSGGTIATNGLDSLAISNKNATGNNFDAFYLLGEMPLSGTSGSVKLGTFQMAPPAAGGWITQWGGTAQTESVYFGTGDAAVDNRPLTVWPFVSVSTLADATITPEPASLALLALAGRALRRR